MQCKQGQLAFIKKSIRSQNVGLIIECQENLGYFLQGDIIEMDGERWGAVISDNMWRVLSPSGSLNTMFGKSKIAISPDTWLHPIDALPEEDNLYTADELEDIDGIRA